MPQPGTGCLSINPLFVNPTTQSFQLQSGSPCIGSGKDGYDIGGVFFTDIPEAPDSVQIIPDTILHTITIRWKNPTHTVQGNPLGALSAIRIFRNDSLLSEIPFPVRNYDSLYVDTIAQGDYYRYALCAVDTNNLAGRLIYGAENWQGEPIHGIVIWELDPTPITGAALVEGIRAAGYSDPIYLTKSSARYPLTPDIKAVFVCLGIYSNNHQLGSEEGLKLKNYLDSGGNVYMEGGDTWYYDPQTPVHPYFGITAISDGGSDLTQVAGDAGTFCEGLQFNYIGENQWIDRIAPGFNSTRILHNPTVQYGVAVAHDGSTYKTIGASCELGGLQGNSVNSSRNELIRRILVYFGVIQPTGLSSASGTTIPEKFTLLPNYPNPFNNRTVFTVGLPRTSDVRMEIYTITGQKVYQEEQKGLNPGWHHLFWDGQNRASAPVASGFYIYRITAQNASGQQYRRTGKLQLIK